MNPASTSRAELWAKSSTARPGRPIETSMYAWRRAGLLPPAWTTTSGKARRRNVPFNPTIVGGAWRWLFDYGTGDLGNDGVHRIDYCRFAMGLDEMPASISSTGGKFFFTDDDQEWPDTILVNYEYPEHIIQYEMRLWSKPKLFGATEGAAVYGENGWMLLTNSSWTAYDAEGKVAQAGTK
jgi:hypothetical protein